MTKLEEMIAILVGPGAMCRMGDAEADDVARDILAALREPSEAMMRACGSVDDAVNAEAIWQAGIDSILKEANEG